MCIRDRHPSVWSSYLHPPSRHLLRRRDALAQASLSLICPCTTNLRLLPYVSCPCSPLRVVDRLDRELAVTGWAPPEHGGAHARVEQSLGERRDVADLAGLEVGLVLADDHECAPGAALFAHGDGGAELHHAPWLAPRLHEERRLEAPGEVAQVAAYVVELAPRQGVVVLRGGEQLEAPLFQLAELLLELAQAG